MSAMGEQGRQPDDTERPWVLKIEDIAKRSGVGIETLRGSCRTCNQRRTLLDVCFVSSAPVERHPRAGGHPVPLALVPWIPAFAGMTQGCRNWQCIYEMDI